MSEKRLGIIRISVPLEIEIEERVPADAKHDDQWSIDKRDDIVGQVLLTLRSRLPKKYTDVTEQFVNMPEPTVRFIDD